MCHCTVSAWGQNSYGQLGNGTFTWSFVPVQVTGLSDGASVAGVAAGAFHSLAYERIVVKTDTSLSLSAATGQIGKRSTFVATLKDKASGAPLVGKPVQFAIDGANVGAPATTASTGTAKVVYIVPEGT